MMDEAVRLLLPGRSLRGSADRNNMIQQHNLYVTNVAPCTGARIETTTSRWCRGSGRVAPCAGARIEPPSAAQAHGAAGCRSLRGSADRNRL